MLKQNFKGLLIRCSRVAHNHSNWTTLDSSMAHKKYSNIAKKLNCDFDVDIFQITQQQERLLIDEDYHIIYSEDCCPLYLLLVEGNKDTISIITFLTTKIITNGFLVFNTCF